MAMLGTPLGRILLDKVGWTYLLGPFFEASTPDQAAPLSATYREAGAVGALTVTDASNILSVSGGELVWNGTAAANTGAASPGIARNAGRALIARSSRRTSGLIRYGWHTAAAVGTLTYGVRTTPVASAIDVMFSSGVLSVTGLATGDHDYVTVLRGTGAFMLYRAGGTGAGTLLWVYANDSTATMYAMLFAPATTVADGKSNTLRVVDLGGAWASDTGIAVAYAATTANGDLALMTANALVYHTVTAATGVTQELSVRRTDDSNRWVVRMDQVGSTVKLIEIVAGVETERSSAAQTWVNGTQYRVGVILDGNTINTFVANVAKNSYASASFNNTATGIAVSHAGGPLESWPRTVALPTGV